MPFQYGDEWEKTEIECNLRTTGNVRRIQYRLHCKTNDFHFTDTYLNQYNSALKLSRILIENSFCMVIPLLKGNRMTYCVKCWRLWHTRENCLRRNPRYLVCPSEITEGQSQHCTNIPCCAQCGEKHHSLASQCGKVNIYRTELKEQVNQALSWGILYRLQTKEHAPNNQSRMKNSEFLALESSSKSR